MTPCEKLGYKVGDEFEVVEEGRLMRVGDRLKLMEDDGSECPEFECIDCVDEDGDRQTFTQLRFIKPLSVTLRPGDYCSTANMTEDDYHAVAAAFMAAGCDADTHGHLDYGKVPSQPYLEWYRTDLCSTTKPEPGGRHLTPAQIIGAVNAKTPEQQQADVHIIKEVNEKLEKLRAAEHEYRKALAKLRNSLPNHAVVEMGGNPQQDAQPTGDLTDPGNWRAGDVVEYHGGGQPRSWYTIGKHYELKKQGGRLGVIDNDGDFMAQRVKAGRFTFVHRP